MNDDTARFTGRRRQFAQKLGGELLLEPGDEDDDTVEPTITEPRGPQKSTIRAAGETGNDEGAA